MTAALEELKTRARIRLNGARRTGEGAELRLRDCLHDAARAVGFSHWEHARRVLGGEAAAGEDMGSFWHAPRCNTLLNHWYADAQAARAAHAKGNGFLLPYRRQFVLVQDEFIRELALDPRDANWSALGRDLVAGYGSAAWQALCAQRVRAPQETFDR
jgi:hypothetical protein